MYKDENHYTLCRRGKLWGYYWYDSNNKRHYRSTGRKTLTLSGRPKTRFWRQTDNGIDNDNKLHHVYFVYMQ